MIWIYVIVSSFVCVKLAQRALQIDMQYVSTPVLYCFQGL